jgi:dTDP-4-amino-4,6-dideoxygalactose transaminase
MADPIPFSRPYPSRHELENLAAVLASGHVHGDGAFTASATQRLRELIPTDHALLTSSGTHALEMASLLLGLGPGDEVIMPSFTFPSAATAVTLVGATPVFVDSDPTTGNIAPEAVAAAVTGRRTRAISVMHYGGVAVDLTALEAIAQDAGVPLIEDNAHGLAARLDGRPLGTFGALAIQSFHDTKNIHSGEGGALLINDPDLMERAEIIREKGTNRSRFLRGQVDKYTWVDLGSSYLMDELSAAVLDSQLADFETIQALRHDIWDRYATSLAHWADELGATLMHVPDGREHPAHLYYVLMPDLESRDALLSELRSVGVIATFHYIPLDDAPAGLAYGRTPVPCIEAHRFSDRVVRLPLWAGMRDDEVDRVVAAVTSFRPSLASRR